MYPPPFEYTFAESVTHAIELLGQSGGGAKLLSGGQSLVPLLKLRLVRPTHLVDVGRIADLAYVRQDNGFLAIGGLTTHAQVAQSPLVVGLMPLVAEATASIGDPQVRAWGTVGGALAQADPAGDWGPAILALRGGIECTGPRGSRLVQSDAFFVDAYMTVLAEDELITGIRVPVPEPGSIGIYLKLERRAGDFAVASVALQLGFNEDGTCRVASIALGAAGLTPIRAVAAEACMQGQSMTREVIDAASEEVFVVAEPLADVRGSEVYKRAVCRALFKKAVDIALRKYGGEEITAGHVP